MQLTREQIQAILTEEISNETKQVQAALNTNQTFLELGLDSLSCIYVLHQVEKRVGLQVNPSVFWDHPTISALTEHLFKMQYESR